MKINEKRGFTLLEVMVAISILAIAMTALLGNQGQSVGIADESRFGFVSSMLARQKIAELQLSGGELYANEGDFGEEYPGYFWKTEVGSPDFTEYQYLSGSEPFLLRLEVMVYTENQRNTHNLTHYLLINNK